MIFRVFCISSANDRLFSTFFAHRLQAKRYFSQFLMKNRERKAIFIVFRSSLASETLFFAFSVFRLRATNDFQHFLTFPRTGKPIFAVFQSSQPWESIFCRFSKLSSRTFYQLRETLRSNAYCYHTICRQLQPSILHIY